tara:strand:+ start:293 stop:478 length:186 start_codon:yes stop_codon:yes gene_type:complete
MVQTGAQMAMPPQQAMAQITVPAGAVPGQQIQVNVNGAGMILTVPPCPRFQFTRRIESQAI